MTQEKHRPFMPSPLMFMSVTLASIFTVEAVIMPLLLGARMTKMGLIDSSLLIVFVIPVLYLSLYRPMISYLSKTLAAKEELYQANDLLEVRVRQRTEELARLNNLLRDEYSEALRLSEEKYKNVIESLGVGVMVINREMRINTVNNQMTKWYPHIDFLRSLLALRSCPQIQGKKFAARVPSVRPSATEEAMT